VTFFGQSDPDEVTIEIGSGPFGAGKGFRYWTRVEIRRAIDSYSSIGFVAPFERDRKEFRDAFRPFTYPDLIVKIGDDPIFTGVVVDVDPTVEPTQSSVSATGYAKPAVFEDCNAPASLYPIEFRNLKIGSIARALAEPFEIGVTILDDEGAAFDRVALEPDQKIQEFLADLARQRGLVLSDAEDGDLLLWKSVESGNPIAIIGGQGGFPPSEGPIQPITRVIPRFRPREFYSEVTGLAKAKRAKTGSSYTITTIELEAVRPFTFKVDDTEKGELPAAVAAKHARMFGNMVSYEVGPIPTWRDPKGGLFTPNTTIKLAAPDAMIYTETEFLIRAVTLTREADEKTATLELVLPGAFDGIPPEVLPWAD
jgi:prophage tail gpP-like protein